MQKEKLKGMLKGNVVEIVKKENPYWRVFYSNGYGEEKENAVILTIIEALHLVEKGQLDVVSEKGKISREELFNKLNDVGNWTLYIVYKDLRNRGYVIKLAKTPPLSIFVYPRGKTILEAKPTHAIIIAEASKEIKLIDLDKAIKASKEEGVDLLIGIVDEIGEVTYYEIEEALDESQ